MTTLSLLLSPDWCKDKDSPGMRLSVRTGIPNHKKLDSILIGFTVAVLPTDLRI